MSDSSAFFQAGFAEATGFVAWDSPLGCADRPTPTQAAPPEPSIDVEALREDAYAQGYEEGRRAAEAAFDEDRLALATIVGSLDALRHEPTEALAALIAATVERLVTQVIGEVPVNPIVLVKRAEAAAALIGEEVEAARLLVSPADLPLFARTRIPVEIASDPALPRGDVRLEWGRGWIEDGPTVRLARLRAALDKLGTAE